LPTLLKKRNLKLTAVTEQHIMAEAMRISLRRQFGVQIPTEAVQAF
jgi:hypothetical protein